jgi:hypothetical protein
LLARQKVSGIFATSVFCFLGATVLIKMGTIDLNSVFKALWLGSLGGGVSGVLGYYIGKISEKTEAHHDFFTESSYDSDDIDTDDDLLIDNTMMDDLSKIKHSE